MKTTKTLSIITSLMIFTLIILPNRFAQGASPAYIVRALHFVPKNLKHDPNVEDEFDKKLKEAQQFFADEMERHGFGRKTFRLETDSAGKVVFHRVKGRFGSAHYATDPFDVYKIDSPQMLGFDTSKSIYVNIAGFIPAVGAVGGYATMGEAVVVAYYNNKDTCQFAATDRPDRPLLHELGHAFNLPHDWRTGTLMSYGVTDVPNQLSKCAAEWLDGHRYFNRNPIDIDTTPTTIEMLPPRAYPPNAIRLRFQITDADGLHQAQLIGPTDYSEHTGAALLACRLLSEKQNTMVEFITTELVLGPESFVSLGVIDKHGNITRDTFSVEKNEIRVERQNRIDINGDGVTNAADRIPARLRKVSGDNQSGIPNAWFPKPLVVEVLDANGTPVEGVQVEFRVRVTISDRVSFSSDGYENHQFGILSDPLPRTDANGQAKSFLMLGDDQVLHPELFKYKVTVSVSGIAKPVSFDTFDWSVKVLIPPEDGDEMYWITNEAGKLEYSGSRWEFITNTMVRSHAIDVVSDGFGRLFYLTGSDVWGNKEGLCATITRIDRSARRWRKVVIQPTSRTLGIAVHPRKSKLYWTNALGNIQTCNLEGSNIQNLITGLNAPKHITVDTVRDKLYWTDGKQRIQRADLNGKNIQVFARSHGTLGHITVAGNHLYWAEKINEASGNIRCANIKTKSKNIRTVVRNIDAPIGVDIAYDKLYWTDTAGRIQRANLDGSHIEDVAIRLAAPGALAILQRAARPSAAPVNMSVSPPPEATTLLPNYPNPFNPETWIPYQLAQPANATLTIYAMNGRLIRTLPLGHQPAGRYHSRSRAAYWDGKNKVGEQVASGIYFYTLTAGDFTATGKMLIRK